MALTIKPLLNKNADKYISFNQKYILYKQGVLLSICNRFPNEKFIGDETFDKL